MSARGSSALTGEVDVTLTLRRYRKDDPNDHRRILLANSRFDETPAEVVLELRDDEYVYLGQKASADRRDRFDTIREILPNDPPGMTAAQVREAFDVKPAARTLRTDLKNGVIEQMWERTGKGAAGDPFRYWIRNSQPTPPPPVAEDDQHLLQEVQRDTP